MKKITLLVVSIFLVGSVANASEIINLSDENYKMNVRFDENEPIHFTERGIEFFVFSNGEFDFNTRPEDSQGDYYYKTAGHRGADVSVNRHQENFGVKIERDSFGRIRRIGNTFINYDYTDRVSRIGSVFMRYNRFALSQVGGLQIIYNRYGQIVDIYGSVKGYYRNSGYVNNDHDYRNNNGHNNDYYNNDNNDDSNNDDHYYYYKKDGSKVMIAEKKEKILDENKKENKE